MAEQYHEPVEKLTAEDKDMVRSLMSLKEEIETIIWYQQRAAAGTDEEIEHAVMALEWLRRNMDEWHDALKTYLFTEKPIVELEDE